MDRHPGQHAALSLGVLGSLEVVRDGERIDLTRDAHRRLLTLLATSGGRRVPTEELIDRFWDGAPPATAKTALQTHVSAVRGIVPNSIATEGHGYALASSVTIDVHEFEADARVATRAHEAGEWTEALDAADRALGRWRGVAFEELPDDERAIAERARLDEMRARSSEVRCAALVELGRHAEALADLERIVVDFPLRERTWELMAVARWRLGRTAEALRAIHDARAALADAGLVPGHGLRETERQILVGDEAPRPSIRLPNPLTSFVGRHAERRDVAAHVASQRLVTITGVGGAGKSRLAIETARALLEDDEAETEVAWFVELATMESPDQIVPAVAAVVGASDDGASPAEAIVQAIGGRPALVVLDNCEHVVDVVAPLARAVLELGTSIRILATSRLALGITGELVYSLPPLDVEVGPGGRVAELDGVRLFVDRARLARPGLHIDERDLDVVADICRALDGLPLAIELAAARARTVDLSTIAERTADRLQLLRSNDPSAPARHRTIEATIRWSHDLLDRNEQLLLRRLAVFSSPIDLATVEAVCGGDELDVLDVLDHLVTASLVSVRAGPGGHRYELLSTVREFAWARALEAGEAAMLERRHVDHFTEVTAAKAAAPRGALPDRDLADGVAVEEVRAAVERARRLEHPRAIMLLAGFLGRLADLGGRPNESLTWFDIALEGDAGIEERRALRACRSHVKFFVDDSSALAEFSALIDEMVDEAPSLVRAGAALRAGHTYQLDVTVDPNEARRFLELAASDGAALGHPQMELRGRSFLAFFHAWVGDNALAYREAEHALALARRLDDPIALVRTLDLAISVLMLTGEHRDSVRAYATEELAVAEQLSDHDLLPLDWLSYALLLDDDVSGAERAVELEASETFRAASEDAAAAAGRRVKLAYVRWFAGDLQAARDHLVAAEASLTRRWYHDFYLAAAEVAAELGDHDRVDRYVDRYLAVPVDATEEVLKLGVLRPAVRSAVDRALADPTAADVHIGRAERHVAWMRDAIAASPVRRTGALQVETPATLLALAEAELARLADDPTETERAWRAVADLPDYPWYRRYVARRADDVAAPTART